MNELKMWMRVLFWTQLALAASPGVGWEEDWIEGHHVWIRRQS